MCTSLACLAAPAWSQDGHGAPDSVQMLWDSGPLAPLYGALLVALALGFTPLAWRLSAMIAGTGRQERSAEARPVAWGFTQIALVCLCALVSLAGLRLLSADGDGSEPDLPTLLTRSALALGTTGALIAGIAHVLDPQGLRALGLRSGGVLRGAIGGWFAYAAMLPGWIGLAIFWRWLLERCGISSEVQVVVAKFMELEAPDVPLALVLGILVMPFLEELVFRGFLQPVFVKHVGARWGVVLTSLVFGALHGPSAFLPIFGLSLVLGTVMLRTQRLVAAWAVHAFHNGLVFAALVFLRSHPDLLHKTALLAFS